MRSRIPASNLKTYGQRALVVTGRDSSRAEKLLANLRASGISTATFAVSGEPELATVEQGAKLAKAEQCEFVIGFGGGSALDAAKAIAAMLKNEGELLDYIEIIGRGQTLKKRPAPFIAIPTTAGTGSEVTRNAVLSSPEHKVKVSLRSPLMLARVAIVDPNSLTIYRPRSRRAPASMHSRNSSNLSSACAQIRWLTVCALMAFTAPRVLCAKRFIMGKTNRHAKTWRWQVCSVGWHWPIRVSVPSMVLPGRLVECFPHHTARFVPPCCRM